jgi:hypothetical protein
MVGALERLGVRPLADKTIERRNVVSIRPGRSVVRAPAAKRSKR